MDATKLIRADGRETSACLCGKCLRIWESHDSAERCCKCGYCGEYCDWKHGSVSHRACMDDAFRKTEEGRLEEAALVPDYDGPFLWDGRVYENACDLLDCVEPEDLPEFGYCAKYEAPRINVGSIIDGVAEEMHDDWEAEGVEALAAAVEAWNKANKDNGSYFEDYRRKWSKKNLLELAGIEQ